ncbi:MAG: CCA tRNA nucleotidyltransferase [Janthinobacterium lividum]
MKEVTPDKIFPDWLLLLEVQYLFSIVDPKFQKMRFVGGCIRDYLLGKPVTDFDLATSLLPTEVIHLLEKAQIKTVPVGLSHGTVLAVIGCHSFEITTLRHDIETDGRHAVVSYTENWLEDAKRRDFTFNALYLSATGQLYDPWQGQNDLQQGIVRFIGDARVRVQEDYLRILRYFRFLAHYGHGPQDDESLIACQTYASCLEKLSVERIQRELIKLFQAKDPQIALQRMVDHHVWSFIFKEIKPVSMQLFKRLIDFEQQYQLEPSPECRLALLLAQESPEKTDWFLTYLKFSRKQSSEIAQIIKASHQICKNVHELLYIYGFTITQHALLLQMARGYNELLWDQMPKIWERPLFPLKGKDLQELGLEAGPLWGKILHHVETWWIYKNFQPSKDECWEEAQVYAKRQQHIK